MAFNFKKKEQNDFSTPQEMYRDYRERKIKGPLDYQSKMIDVYMSEGIKKGDVAIELPTGSGKTVIGLLIAEFRRRKFKEKVVYLCPNNQLVNQVVEAATEKYGIHVTSFTGSRRNYSPESVSLYTRNESIAITNYSSIFNVNSFFKDADVLIFDDAHSSESYIASNWSVNVTKYDDQELFYQIAEVLKPILDSSQYRRLTEEKHINVENSWCDMLSVDSVAEIHDSFYDLMEEFVSGTSKQYSWSNIKNNLHACNILISNSEILIKPLIAPTLSLQPFATPKQRIYMSATLGESGELERITGVNTIHRLPMVDDFEVKSIGRRYFLFPNASFSEKQSLEIMTALKKKQSRALILVESENELKKVTKDFEKEPSTKIYKKEDLNQSFENFSREEDAIAILANRYDGIDLDEEKCRMLMLYALPSTTNLQEKFFISKLATSLLFSERIKTRLIQAIGRCTRSDTDYSTVIILGHDLENMLISPKKLQQFEPELRAELDVGYDISCNLDNLDKLLENVDAIYERKSEWKELEQEIISRRNIFDNEESHEKNLLYKNMQISATHEVDFQYNYWNNRYEAALSDISKILSQLDGNELKGYRAYWTYMAGTLCRLIFENNGTESYRGKANSYFNEASNLSNSVNWFAKLKVISKTKNVDSKDIGITELVNNIEDGILKGSLKKQEAIFNRDAAKILDMLNSNDGETFENGIQELGLLLGYNSNNNSGSAAPDPWWIIDDKNCIVSECKIYKDTQKNIPPNQVKQASKHKEWLYTNEPSIDKDCNIRTVFITNSSTIDASAVVFSNGVYYLNRDRLLSFARKSIGIVRRIRETFVEPGDIIWRTDAADMLIENSITPNDIIDLISSYKLSDLEIR